MLVFPFILDRYQVLIRIYAAHATKVPGLIFVSGQVPIDQDAVIIPGGIQEHTVSTLTGALEVPI